MRILLVRHGESAGNVDTSVHAQMADHDIPLSPRGVEQAAQAAAFFKTWCLWSRRAYRIWASPYRRTRQTADAFRQLGSPLIDSYREHVLLCEQQWGLFDGIPVRDLPTRFPAEYAHYQKHEQAQGRFWARMPLGESRFDVATRVHQAFGTFQRDAAAHGIENLIVVAHGVTIRAFVMMWLHLPYEWFEAEPNPKNGSIRLLEDGEDRGYIYVPKES